MSADSTLLVLTKTEAAHYINWCNYHNLADHSYIPVTGDGQWEATLKVFLYIQQWHQLLPTLSGKNNLHSATSEQGTLWGVHEREWVASLVLDSLSSFWLPPPVSVSSWSPSPRGTVSRLLPRDFVPCRVVAPISEATKVLYSMGCKTSPLCRGSSLSWSVL